MKTSRRDFLKCASILGSTLFINSNSLAANAQTSHLNTKRLVYVFLKGGVDTLGIIAPTLIHIIIHTEIKLLLKSQVTKTVLWNSMINLRYILIG